MAREAGVTQGLVAHHFGTRDELIRDALVYAAQTLIERSALQPPSGRIEDLAAGLPDLVAKGEAGQAFQFELALEARRREELLPAARELYLSYLEATAGALRSVGVWADADFTRVVFAALDGLAFQQLLFGDPEPTERAIAELHACSSAPVTPKASSRRHIRAPRPARRPPGTSLGRARSRR